MEVFGQRAEDDRSGHLVVREVCAAVLNELGLARLNAGLEFDERTGRLPPDGIGLRHDCRGEDTGVPV